MTALTSWHVKNSLGFAAGWVMVLLAVYQRLHGDIRPAATFLNQNAFAGAILLLLPIAALADDWALAGGLLLCLWWARSVGSNR